jgi:Ger(x)C family germination protein
MRAFAIAVVAAWLLTGCWDGVELENRAFVNAIGIDADDEGFSVSLSVSDLDTLIGKKSDDDKNALKEGRGAAFMAALREAGAASSRKAYFGHTKVVVLGGGLLSDEQRFRETLDALERDYEMSGKMIIIATEGKAAEALTRDVAGEPAAGLFVTYYYKNNFDAAPFRQDLAKLIRELYDNNCALIPSIDGDQLKLGGVAVIKNYRLAGWLDGERAKGCAWVTGGRGMLASVPFGGAETTIAVARVKTKLRFSEENGGITCRADINVTGGVTEAGDGNIGRDETDALRRLYEEKISKEALESFLTLKGLYADGFRLGDAMRKYNNDLFIKYDKDAILELLTFTPNVTVKIVGTGATI